MRRTTTIVLLCSICGLAPIVVAPPAAAAPAAPAETTCDFNGDGTNDLAIGVPGEDGKGAVNIQYTTKHPLDKPAIITGQNLPEGASYGTALSCGDFDSNGIDDLAVGAPYATVGGRVYVHFGQAAKGLSSTSAYQTFTQDTAGVPGVAQVGDQFGFALETGDFNDDGRDDLAVGVPSDTDDAGGRGVPVGSVIVVRGGPPGTGLDFAAPIQQLFGWSEVASYEVDRQQFGWSLTAGPFVPGYAGDSLVVGAPHTTIVNGESSGDCRDWDCGTGEHPGQPAAGRVYLFRDDFTGLVPYQSVDQEYGAGWGTTSEPDDWFGYAVSGGDYDGDGFFDLAVGSPGEGLINPTAGAAGMVHVVHGPILGPVSYGEVTPLFESTLGGANEVGDEFGWSVTSGDYDVDGRDDLAVGAPFEDIEGRLTTVLDAGAVFVFYGDAADVIGDDGMIRYQGIADTPDASEEHDWFGASLATVAATLGEDDLVIGIPGEEGPGAHEDAMIAGAATVAVGWPDEGPATCSCFFLHQDAGAPFNVSDTREISWSGTPAPMTFGELLEGDPWYPTGELYGWAAAG
jgi:hypothetical protein